MTDFTQILEFNQTIGLIAGRMKTYSGLEKLNALRIGNDPDSINASFLLVKEMNEFLRFDGSMVFEETISSADLLKNTPIAGYYLGTDEILEIRKILSNWKNAQAALEISKEKYSRLTMLLFSRSAPEGLMKRIDFIMDADGNIKDNASEELKRVRRRKTTIRGDIQGRLNSLLESGKISEVIQDKIISFRDGRFVIPVRAQFKNKVRSDMNYIVHSYSKTGETAFVEPQEVIPLNNEMVEIDEQEMQEIRRILRELTATIAQESENISEIDNLLGDVELIFAKAKFAIEYRCSYPKIVGGKPYLHLKQAFHPLLGVKSVPIDLDVGIKYDGLIISGPNAGGKTVAIKTAGLLTLMALYGLPITAQDGSEVGLFKKVMAEIGDEQSIAENLSSFSGHIVAISEILKLSDTDSLVLIDEIASSTEPKEGEAIGRGIILELLKKGAKFIITTHFQGIKEIAFQNEKVQNAFVEFDEEKLVPLYRLHTEGTGSSYALKIARKFGLSEEIIREAELFLSVRASESEKLLKALEKERNNIAQKLDEYTKNLAESNRVRQESERLLAEMQEEKKLVQKKGVSLLRKELDDALKEIAFLKKEMKKSKFADIKTADQKIQGVQEFLKTAETEILQETRRKALDLKVGQNVFVGTFNKEGYIEDISGHKVKVRLGIISTMVDREDLYLSLKDKQEKDRYTKNQTEISAPSLYLLDIRGNYVEEALKILEKNLDNAMVNGAGMMEIIHGKGEGKLRKAVWDFLKSYKGIKKYDYAKPEEGGQGKTIVHF